MELSPRKQAVLAAVAKTYIKTGEPVGSKALNAILKNSPSSATLRNEMSELCELGLLAQPHTSAGRIPTSNGFKIYVDTLMTPEKLSEGSKSFIDKSFSDIHSAPEKLPEIAGKLLSELTGLPAVTCFIIETGPKVKRIELLPIGKKAVMIVLITADGRTRSRIIRTDMVSEPVLIERFTDIAEKKINGKKVSDLTKGYMQGLTADAGLNALTLMPVFSAVFEMAQGLEASSVTLSGEAALHNVFADDETAKRIISLVNLREPMLSLLDGIDGRVGVIFGNDTGFTELNSDAIVAARYSGKDKYKGTVGVIGPNRMSYDQIIPSVEYTALKLTELMTQAQKDMEE